MIEIHGYHCTLGTGECNCHVKEQKRESELNRLARLVADHSLEHRNTLRDKGMKPRNIRLNQQKLNKLLDDYEEALKAQKEKET